MTLVVPTAFAEASKLSKIETDVESETYKSEKGGLYTRDGGQLVWVSRDAEKFDVPKGVVRIGDCAFANCKNLVAVSMPVGVKSIGLCSFLGCSSLESVDFPDSLKQIGDRAFENCTKLRRAKISGKSEIYRGQAFKNCVSLSSVEIAQKSRDAGGPARFIVNEPQILTPVGVRPDDFALSAVVDSDLEEIKCEAFSGCKSLEQIVLPASLKKIGGEAFFGCSSLKSLVIPCGTSFVGRDAFTGCALYGALRFSCPVNWMRTDSRLGCIDVDPKILGEVSKAYDFWLEHIRDCDMVKKVREA